MVSIPDSEIDAMGVDFFLHLASKQMLPFFAYEDQMYFPRIFTP